MAVGRVFPNEIDRLFNAPGGPLGREARATALEVAIVAQTLAVNELGKHPMDAPRTGEFARAFEVRVLGRSTQFQVRNRKAYAAAIELGAVAHPIQARRVSYLRFRDRQGRWRSVKMVRHPGNKAYRILERAALFVTQRRYGNVTVT